VQVDGPTPEDRALLAKAITQECFAGGFDLTVPAEVSAPQRYEVVRLLGRGGMGSVYLANDSVLGRQVALKVLASAGPADVERLRREARFTARLESPHIVSVYDLGEHEGQAYIAMQFIDGVNLAQASLGWDSAVRVIVTVARALDVAHREGIVHRDVKPENVLLDKAGKPYLTDFGIARDLKNDELRTQTREGLIMGTPAMMSPEQARGEPRAVDARTDVYCLGATLYFLLARRAPFPGTSVVEVLHAVIHEPPPLPRSIDHTIPRALEDVVMKCLEKERRDRYPNMAELARDLEAFLAGTLGAGGTFFKKLVGQEQPLPRNPRSGSPELAGALEAAAEIAWWDANRYRVTRDLPRSYPRLNALVERLDRVLAERPDAGWARFYRGAALARRGKLERALEDMERSIAALSDSAQAHFELGRLYLELSLRGQEAAEKHLSIVGGEKERHDVRGRAGQALVAFQEAQRLREGLPAWQLESVKAVERLAERDYEGCVRVCEEILAREPEAEEVWRLKGDAEQLAGKEPFASYDRALEIRRSFVEALLGKAEAHLERGAREKARECLERALEVVPEDATARVLLGRGSLGGDEAALRGGLGHVEKALEAEPVLYDALVTKAELEIALERALRKKEWSARALATLERATGAEGCQNRVQYLQATALLERARTRVQAGEDPREDLDRIEALRDHDAMNVPDNEPWLRIFAAAHELRR
jgi:tetratricopeptide (TPR) repeat protein/predicted Ser/Thr protein kinase